MLEDSDIHIRPATCGDYEAVVNILPDAFDGFDYLPTVYFEYLHNPKNVAVVAEVRGKVVSASKAILSGVIFAISHFV